MPVGRFLVTQRQTLHLYVIQKVLFLGIPWWSSGQNSVLSLLRAQAQSLDGELRSHKPRSATKKKNLFLSNSGEEQKLNIKPKSNLCIHSRTEARALHRYMFSSLLIHLNNYVINVGRQEYASERAPLGVRITETNRQQFRLWVKCQLCHLLVVSLWARSSVSLSFFICKQG